jgi:hypothetical protein
MLQTEIIERATLVGREEFITALLDLEPAILRRQPPPPSQAGPLAGRCGTAAGAREVDAELQEIHGMNTVTLIENGLRTARHTVRLIRTHPGFVLTVVLSVALGIGANTAIFGVV